MIDPRRRVRAISAAPGGGTGRATVRPLGGTGSLVISAAAVRGRFGAWETTHSRDARRDLVEWPAALLVAAAIVETGRRALGARDDAAPWELTITVPPSALDLTRQTGLGAPKVRRVLDALISAEVLDCLSRIGDELVVRPRPELFEDAPVVGALAWDAIRERLATALSPAALLVVRALAVRTSVDDRARQSFVPASLRDLEEATGSGKAAVRTALAALTRAGLVESKLRPRVDSWHRLLGAAFGEAGAPREMSTRIGGIDSESQRESGAARISSAAPSPARPRDLRAGPTSPVAPALDGSAVERHQAASSSQRAHEPRPGAEHASMPPGVLPVTTGWAIVEVNGVALPVPPGVVPQPEQDAVTGDWYLRVGPNVRYGPLRFFT